eukprot:CAMPEP_0119036344 /NCGR_PEP_ID=MMETSP1177-20130426/4020_1 /TAXON_ID=2985 /ORGANISM="Ochromonas sp, Strain CCMP1899" /LENGTH=431 /DNA_ID=CAMNT_0006996103 /DNA_START=244 /DNA_END=1539 /DNA_ORIENTATION=-
MLKDEPVKPKVITPNDIASLFGSSSSEASDDISYEDDDEDEVEESAPVNEVEIIKEEIIPQKKTVAEKRSYDSESVAMNELLALQKEYSTPPPSPIVPVSKSETFTEEPEYREEITDDFEDVDELINFNRVLEPESGRRVRQSMTLTENRFANNRLDSNLQTLPRQVKYDPAELLKQARDPMQYGAYRRWKLAEDSQLDSKGKPKKKSKSTTGYNKGDYEVDGAMGGDSIGGSRNVGGNKKKKDKKGGNNLNPESFYDAIKNFGAGGGKDAGTGGTGTAEPPSNKNPIQPKKAQVKKNKKKLITPDDINSLFGKAEAVAEEDEDEDEASVESTSSMDSSVTASSSIAGAFNPMMGNDEETPQWILDADKEALQKKKGKGKKKKALTDDWRFWAGIIGVAGFASAFFNIYQQTGGFGGGDSKGFGEGTELVI